MNWRFISCWKIRRQAVLLACDELSADEAASIQTHLAGCPGCHRYYQGLSELTEQLRAWSQKDSSVEPSQAAHARWVRAINAVTTTEPSPSLVSSLSWRRILAGVTAVWALSVLLRFTAPAVGPVVSHSAAASPRDVLAAIKLPLRVVAPSPDDRKPEAATERPLPAAQPADRLPRSDYHWLKRMG
jgi:anti-sigma factor RsiW